MACHKVFKPSVDNTFKKCDEYVSSDCVYVENVGNMPYLGDLNVDPSSSSVFEALVKRLKELQDKIEILENEINLLK